MEPSARIHPSPVPAARGPAPSRRYRLAVAAVLAVMLTCWTLRIEFFPLTAMQMYTGWGAIAPITYFKAFARNETGETFRAPLEEAIGALSDSRYRRVIGQAFSPKKVEVCKKYLTAIASAYNSKVSPERRLTEFEIQKWTWDFVSNPADPNHGVLVDRFVYKVESRASR